MKLSFILSKECIVPGIAGGERSKREILGGLIAHLWENTSLHEENFSREDLLEQLLSRENELSTGVGEGFAFPHARLKGLKGAYLLLATCPDGVEYAAPDNKTVNFLFLTIISDAHANLLLQARAALMRCLLPLEARTTALTFSTASELWRYIDRSGSSISKDIVARDIMCPQLGLLRAEMTISEAAVLFHKHHSDTLPVIDGEGCVSNVISTNDLFRHTLPAMFFKMKTMSFVKHLDPFEQCIYDGSERRIGEIRRKRELPLPVATVDATLTELLFLMCANDFTDIYILENKQLKGVVSRCGIVDKILSGMGD